MFYESVVQLATRPDDTLVFREGWVQSGNSSTLVITEYLLIAVIVAVAHRQLKKMGEKDFIALSSENALLVDIKGLYRGKIKKMRYWSL